MAKKLARTANRAGKATAKAGKAGGARAAG